MRTTVFCALVASLLFSALSYAGSVSEVLPIGGTAVGEVRPGRPSVIGVLIPEGATKVLFKFKIDSKSGLDPEFTLVRPDGSSLDTAALAAAGASVKVSTKTISVKNVPVGSGGLFKLVVAGRGGTAGGWTVKTKGKPAKGPKLSASLGSAAEADEYDISAPDGALLTVKLSPAPKSNFEPVLEILTSSGRPVDPAAFRTVKKGKTTIKKLPLPFFGAYTLRVTSGTGSGSYKLSAKVKAAKPGKGSGGPVASAGPDVAVAPGTTARLSGSGPAGAAFAWERVSGEGPALESPGTATPAFRAPVERGTHAFQLVVTVNNVSSFGDTVVVDVDQPPVADAGPSLSVSAGASVTLDGSGSLDLDGDGSLTYSWRQVSGANVTLADADTASASFTAPGTSGVLVFELVVNDGASDSVADRILVGVERDVADAGRPVVVSPQDAVYLSGLRTTAGTSSFAWTRVGSGPPSIDLAGAARPIAHFTAPRTAGAHRFRLTVNGDATAADEVTVVVAHGVSNGEPRPATEAVVTVIRQGNIQLSSQASSDPDGDSLSFEWRQDGGTAVPLGGSGADRSGTAPDADEHLGFLLMAHDGLKYGPPDRSTVVVGSPAAPTADAGADIAGEPGFAISLDGSGSLASSGRGIQSRLWTQVSGLDFYDVVSRDTFFDGSAERPVIRIPTADLASLTPDRSLVFRLVVRDDQGVDSPPDFVVVTFENLPVNAGPSVTAQASASSVRPGTVVDLVASGNDSDGDPLTYGWIQLFGPATASIGGSGKASATVVAPNASGQYRFRVTVNDGTGTPNATATATVDFVVNAPPEIAASVSPTSGPPGATVTLDGSGITDPDGDTLSFAWEEVPTSGNSPVTISNPTGASATFVVPSYSGTIAQRTRRYRLTVTDVVGPVSTTVEFVPNRPPGLPGLISNKAKIRYDGADSATLMASSMVDPDGDPLTFTWRIVSGPASSGGTLSSASGLTVGFTVTKPTSSNAGTGGVWKVGAKATDGMETSAEATIDVLAYPSFSNDVWPIIANSCATASCHGNSNTTPGAILLMSNSTTFYNNTVNVDALLSSGKRVAPNEHKKSYLWNLVNAGTMPKGGSKLSQHQINIIRDWIEPEGKGTSGTISSGTESN